MRFATSAVDWFALLTRPGSSRRARWRLRRAAGRQPSVYTAATSRRLKINGPLIHWDCSIWNSFDFASNRDFFSSHETAQKAQRGLCLQPIVEVGTQEQCCHSRRKTCGRKIHGRKMNRRKTSIRALYFSAPHFSARPAFSNQTPEKLRRTTRNQLLVVQRNQSTIHEMSDSLYYQQSESLRDTKKSGGGPIVAGVAFLTTDVTEHTDESQCVYLGNPYY